jgi:hypothetical protein
MPSLAKGKYAYQGNGLGVQRTLGNAGTDALGDKFTATTPTLLDKGHIVAPGEEVGMAMVNEGHDIEPGGGVDPDRGVSLEHGRPTIPPTSLLPSPLSSKRRFSVLDSVNAGDSATVKFFPRASSSRQSSSRHSSSRLSSSRLSSPHDSLSIPSTSGSAKRGRMSGTVALTTIGHGIIDLSTSYRKALDDKEARHQDRMAQHQDTMLHLERQLTLGREERQERQEAMDRAQEMETDLSDDSLAALLEVFQTEEGSAMAYLSIKIESVRKAWVKRKLARVSLPQ